MHFDSRRLELGKSASRDQGIGIAHGNHDSLNAGVDDGVGTGAVRPTCEHGSKFK